MNLHPKVSVLISTFDDAALVEKKLREVQAQTIFGEAEFLFIEAGSPGREREVIAPCCETHPNCRLLTADERIPLFAAWNRGWREAAGRFVCVSNMDDAMHPALLEIVFREMATHRWDIASTLIAKQEASDEHLDSWVPTRLRRLELQPRPGAFFAWRRELLESFGPFDEELLVAGDKDFWARAASSELRYGLIEKILYLYTKHAGQLSKGEGAADAKEADRARCAAKDYPHEWPGLFRERAKRIGLLLNSPIPKRFTEQFTTPVPRASSRLSRPGF